MWSYFHSCHHRDIFKTYFHFHIYVHGFKNTSCTAVLNHMSVTNQNFNSHRRSLRFTTKIENVKLSSHLTSAFVFTSKIKNGFYGNKWQCSNLIFINFNFQEWGWQRAKKKCKCRRDMWMDLKMKGIFHQTTLQRYSDEKHYFLQFPLSPFMDSLEQYHIRVIFVIHTCVLLIMTKSDNKVLLNKLLGTNSSSTSHFKQKMSSHLTVKAVWHFHLYHIPPYSTTPHVQM